MISEVPMRRILEAALAVVSLLTVCIGGAGTSEAGAAADVVPSSSYVPLGDTDAALVTTLTVTTDSRTFTYVTNAAFNDLVRSNAGTYGPKHFTPQSPSYTSTDANGRMSGQVSFAGHWPMSWSYRILAQPYASAAVSDVMETASYYANGALVKSYHDSHREAIDYLFHSTTPTNNGGVPYELASQYVWKWRLAKSSGAATLRAYLNDTVSGSTRCPRALGDVAPNC
jgi:hypothetical protein